MEGDCPAQHSDALSGATAREGHQEPAVEVLPLLSLSPDLDLGLKYIRTRISSNFFENSNYFVYFLTFLVPF